MLVNISLDAPIYLLDFYGGYLLPKLPNPGNIYPTDPTKFWKFASTQRGRKHPNKKWSPKTQDSRIFQRGKRLKRQVVVFLIVFFAFEI